jgi:hypothetical protein
VKHHSATAGSAVWHTAFTIGGAPPFARGCSFAGASFDALGVCEFSIRDVDFVRDPVRDVFYAGGLIRIARLHKVACVRHDLMGVAEEAS